ncbi:hypothetical protein PVAND_002805 [Polypedilum vanderplanki]|uniref:Uncharacterized protein n=1 Tax=Polypedilum vanderplanki TaxID=319348 RepID=A0A9J6BSK9_POLVA|nr:hypothetical protein PVAND_002805 [Polypedilum vanderplanki]
MNFFYFLFILFGTSLTTSAIAKLEPQKCCRNEKNLIEKNRCAKNDAGKSPPIILKCEEKYILNPTEMNEDYYNVTEDARLYIADMDSYLMSSEYCLVNMQEEDGPDIYEIAIVCFPPYENFDIPKISHEIKGILIFTSAIFLFLTLYIYYRLPELRETQDKVTIFTVFCLMTFMIFLGCLQIYVPFNTNFDFCLFLSFPTYFFTISYFAWLNCVIANVWKIIIMRKWKIKESRWYILNHVYAWTFAITMTTIVAYKHVLKPSLGVTSCWFHQNHDQWILVYLPISIMLSINVVLSVWSSIHLNNPNYTLDTIRVLRKKCILYLKLFLLGGFTWIFEVLSYTFNDHSPSAWVWIIIDSLNCLHGVLVFCVLILWRQRIRKELANQKILGFTCPSHWADINNDEQICLENEGKGKYDLVVKALK